MNRRRRVLFTITAAGLAALATYFLWPRKLSGSQTGGAASSFWRLRDRVTGTGGTRMLNEPPVDPRPNRGAKDSVPAANLEPLLEHFSRSPASLALVFMIHQDPRLLLELKDHDRDPTALAMLACYTAGAEKIHWAKRLAALQPDNAFGKLMEGKELLLTGRREEALAAFRAAAERPQLSGGFGEISRLLPEAAAFLPQDQLVDLVFNRLDLPTTVAAGGMLPFNLRDSLAGLSAEQAEEVARTYVELFRKGATGEGFQVVKGEGLTDLDNLFEVEREVLLGTLTSTHGEAAALRIDPEPVSAISARTSLRVKEWRTHRDRLTPAQVDAIVSQVLGR